MEQKGPRFWLAAGCIGVAIAGVVDYLTGNELSFSLFYLIPVGLVTWFSGRPLGLVVSVFAAATWLGADVLVGTSTPQLFILLWNTAVRFGFFVTVALLLPVLKSLEREKELARVDPLTRAANRRRFQEALQAELDRSVRYKQPFTIGFFDLDGFKSVNDKFGHRTGDKVLCSVVSRGKTKLRRTDLLARLGGDEFAILLPEIDQDSAKTIVPKIQTELLEEMKRNGWPITFSFGALTYLGGAITTEELIRQADELMYSVKKKGKNGIAYATYTGQSWPRPALRTSVNVADADV